jgi:adenine-specific DNA-methyltransferase
MPDFNSAFDAVGKLVDTFRANEKYYLGKDFVEATARLTFIDKFFVALGWDVNHNEQTNPYEWEVKI